MDLLIGLWAEQHLPRLDEGQLHEFAAVLDEENPDLFKWLTQQQEPPAHLQHNSIFRVSRLCQYWGTACVNLYSLLW